MLVSNLSLSPQFFRIRILLTVASPSILVFDGHINRIFSVFYLNITDTVFIKFICDVNFLIPIIYPDASIIQIFHIW